jgi:hypothetical protein
MSLCPLLSIVILDYYVNVSILLWYVGYKWKHIYFFITKMNASDGQDNGPVTTKLYVFGPLIITSDVHVLFRLSLYTYTSDGQFACH